MGVARWCKSLKSLSKISCVFLYIYMIRFLSIVLLLAKKFMLLYYSNILEEQTRLGL